MSREQLYWTCQIIGWSLYSLLGIVLTGVYQGFDQIPLRYLLYQVIFVGTMMASTC